MNEEERPDQSRTVTIGSITGGNVVAPAGDVSGVVLQGVAPAQQREVQELLTRLRSEVDAHADELVDPDAIRGSTDFVESELQSDHPNLDVLKTVLAGMVAAAGQVASVVEVITRLQGAVGALL